MLRSATGKRNKTHQLLDEEDMIDEREMLRVQNRIKRRDYENLIEEGNILFTNTYIISYTIYLF